MDPILRDVIIVVINTAKYQIRFFSTYFSFTDGISLPTYCPGIELAWNKTR